jgi:hypothetical protein
VYSHPSVPTADFINLHVYSQDSQPNTDFDPDLLTEEGTSTG